MVAPPFIYASSYSPASFSRELRKNRSTTPSDNEPGKPDWLLIMMVVLLLITLFIASYVIGLR